MILTGVPGNPGIPAIPSRPWSPLSPFYIHTNTHIYRYMGAYFLSSFTSIWLHSPVQVVLSVPAPPAFIRKHLVSNTTALPDQITVSYSENKHICLYDYTYHRWSWLSRFPLWTLWRNIQMQINNRILHFDTEQVRARTATRVMLWSDAHSWSRQTVISFHTRLSPFSLKEWREFTVSSKNTRKWWKLHVITFTPPVRA